MATDKQVSFIRSLYRDIGQEPEEGIEHLSNKQASGLIDELLKLKKKMEPKEDDCYWY